MNLFAELKRRGVIQAGLAYTLFGWLMIQVSDIVLGTFDAPAWLMKAIILVLLAGVPISLVLAWFFDYTSKGLQRTDNVESGESVSAIPGHTVNYIITSLLAAAVLMFALDKFYWKTELDLVTGEDLISIAVLPFTNLSGDEKTDPFAAGIHDDLLTQISKISALRTVSRTSVLSYRNTEQSIPVIAEQLGVDTIVEAGVQHVADRLRINVQLIDGETDSHLWAETYDRQLTTENIFAIQSEITLSIANALRATLTTTEQRALDSVPTSNLEAYMAYSEARASMDSISASETNHAISKFTEAIELDPEFAAAWAGTCTAYLFLYTRGSDRQNFDSAVAACEKALELDDSRLEVHIALGTLYRYFGQYSRAEDTLENANYEKAQATLEHALSLDGMQVDAMIELGLVFARQGRISEAEMELQKAAKLEPGSWTAQTALFSLYYSYSGQPGRFELAAEHARRGATLRPDLASSWNNLGSANYLLGRNELAVEAWQQSLDIEPTRTGYTNIGTAYYYSDNFIKAAELQEKAIELAPGDHRAMGRLADALRFIDGEEQRSQDAYRRAGKLAQNLLEINNKDWRTLGLLARYQANLGAVDKAQESIQRALELSNRNTETLTYLALVQLQNGDIEQSLSSLEEAIAKEPEYLRLVQFEPAFNQLENEERFKTLIQQSSD